MLIDSPRLSDVDRAVWARAAAVDAATARSPRVDQLTARARAEIAAFADEHGTDNVHIGVSWGRDSVTIAHLAHGLGLRLVHVTHGARTDRISNPDCAAVRDAYLARFPAPYEEIGIERPRAYQWLERQPGYGHRITGLRADESWARAKSRAVHGTTTGRSCRPIIDWRSADVWAYLARHDLPTHPAYAASFGGLLPRDRLRVASLGGDRGADHGRWEWENHYYPEVRSVRPAGRRYQA